MNPRLATLVLILALAAPAILGFGPAERQAPAIDLSLVAGYNGYYRQNQWVALRVNVANTGADFTGAIRVRGGGGTGLEATTFQMPVELPQGARKQLFLYTTLEPYTSRVQLEVVDGAGEVVQRESAPLRMIEAGDVLYAVVTESPRGAVDMTAQPPGSAEAFQAQWLPDYMPPLVDALAGLDVILVHDADTGALAAEQVAALQRWVLQGGHLIVSGGETWQRTTAGLLDLLPVTPRGSVTVDGLEDLAVFTRQPSGGLDTATTAANSAPNPGTRVLAEIGGVPLLVRGSYGAGTVDFLAVDPNAEPLRSWANLSGLWYALIMSVDQQPSWADGFSNWAGARAASETMLRSVLPSFVQLCGFLALYIVLLGPLNYLVLKRLNRREWAWFTIPALVVAFSVLAYTVGFNLRGSAPVVNRMNVVRAWPDSEQAQVMTLLGVQSPRRNTYDVAVERGFTLRPLPGEGVGLNVPVTIDQSTRYAADDVAIDAGTIASLVTTGYTASPTLGGSVTWHMQQGAPLQVTGRVANNSGLTLHDAVLVVKGAALNIGTLAPGESETFDFALGPQDPAPATLGTDYARYLPYSYGGQWGSNWGGPSWCFSYAGIYLTVKDVMGGAPFSCANNVSQAQQEIRRRYRLLSALIVDSDLSGGRGSRAYVFGWASQPLLDVELIGDRSETEDTTLYVFELPVDVSPARESVEVPPAMTLWMPAATSDPATLIDLSPLDFDVGNGQQAVFQFLPLPAARLSSVDTLQIDFKALGTFSVELWNWDAERWVRVPLNGQVGATLLSGDPDPYAQWVPHFQSLIGPENAVRLRVLNLDPGVYSHVEYITVGYQGTLAERVAGSPTARDTAQQG